MKRKVEREKKIPAFEIGITDLELLLERLYSLFEDPGKVICSIDISLKNESLSFDGVDDIKKYPFMKGDITQFYIWLSQGECKLYVSSRASLSGLAIVRATADNEAWCAGAIETISTFLLSHRVWYHWFIAWPLGVISVVLGYSPILLVKLGFGEIFDHKWLSIPWIFIAVIFVSLFIAKGRFLPLATIRITKNESFIKRRSTEISLIITLVATLLTVAGWFIEK